MTADPEPAGWPVGPVRRSSRGPSAGLVLAAVVAVVVAAVVIAFATAPGPAPDASRPAVADVSPSPSATTPAEAPSSAPRLAAAATPGTVILLRGVADPAGALGALTGCTHLRRVSGPELAAIRGVDVDAVVQQAGRGDGWLFVPPGLQAATKVWLGDDVVGLALAVGQPLVAVGTQGDVWLGGLSGATRWRPITTPAGRTAWAITNDEIVGTGTCAPAAIPADIAGLRSLTCAGADLVSCLGLLPLGLTARAAPTLPGGDLVVAVAPCIDSHRCYAIPVAFVGVPSGWSGSLAQLKAVAAGQATDTIVPLSADSLPAYAIEALSRPALPLPTGGERVQGNTCSKALTGPLHGSPWDPRVAWVGSMPVVWPSGTAVRFLPRVQLTLAGALYGSTAPGGGTSVELVGMPDRDGVAFDACRVVSVSGGNLVTPTPATTPGPVAGRGTGS